MTSLLPQPLANIVTDIERAIEAGLYYPALAVALTLPDICISLGYDRDRFVKQPDYVGFVRRYIDPDNLGVDAEDCYRLRGGVLHRGNAAGHLYFGDESTHAICTLPGSGIRLHGLYLVHGEKKAAMIDLKNFCDTMIRAVLKWYAEHRTNVAVQENIPNLLSLRPNGIAPFVVGTPLVASGPE